METYFVFTDGASRGNPGRAAAGFILKNAAGKICEKCGKSLGTQTNNFAEYSAVLLALERLPKVIDSSNTKLVFKLDSELAVKQLKGEYKIKNPILLDFFKKIKSLENSFGGVEYNHIPRRLNTEADKLVNQVLDNKWPS